jgi:crossover junction endodeoxyribonuclease RuvC
MRYTILGIDPGIADTGWGIIESDKNNLKYISCGSIKTDPNEDLASRLEVLHIKLEKIISKFKPDIIAVEQLFFCANVKTALIVGHARGVVLLTAKENNLKIKEFTPLQVKQAVSAYGAASKMQVQRMVKTILNLKEVPKPDDAADALAVAIAGANSNGY